MIKDRLKIFNRELAADLKKMDDEEIWSFIQSREQMIKEGLESKRRFKSGVFYAYNGGQEWFREHFLDRMEECREGVIYTLILDCCLGDEEIELGYWAISGFLDAPDSCAVKTSDEIMPELPDPDDEDYDLLFTRKYFHLLENKDARNIIRSMRENADKLTLNTAEDTGKIERMHEFCEKNPGYQLAYFYDVYLW